MNKKINVGMTYGDPAGIGPEILTSTLNNWQKLKLSRLTPMVIGSKRVLKNVNNNAIFIDNGNNHNKYVPGKPNKISGQHAYECLKQGVLLAKKKKIKALITGPVSKKIISLSTKRFSGQTDAIANLCGLTSNDVIMIFVAKDLRIALFTRHIALNSISQKIQKKKLKSFIILLNAEIKKWFKIKKPKIQILGLNPHAGESGMFGNEEIKFITPVIKELRKKGIAISGPASPDAALAEAGRNYLTSKKQKYDIYVSLYHDQALPMFKAVAGHDGVNVTLGLPFLRVSPDHGTAFDIAGKKTASNSSFISAIKFLESIV